MNRCVTIGTNPVAFRIVKVERAPVDPFVCMDQVFWRLSLVCPATIMASEEESTYFLKLSGSREQGFDNSDRAAYYIPSTLPFVAGPLCPHWESSPLALGVS
jgi:hypothetical protein